VQVGLPDFELVSADSVEEACALLSELGEGTSVFAGGTDLFTRMRQRRMIPRRLLNIKPIQGLDRICHDERDGLRIGALTTIQAIEVSPLVAKKFPALRQAAAVLGTTQIRNIGTLGGNLANASPSAEFAPPLLTLGASVRCTGVAGERVIPMEELFLAPGKTSLKHDELVTEVHVPNVPAGGRSVYMKHSLRKMDVAIACAAVLVVLQDDVCTDVRIALGAVAPTPFRAKKAEQVLLGQRLTGEAADLALLDAVAQAASRESFPIDDLRAYAGYRRKLVAMLVGDGLERATERRGMGRAARA
jgi:carbon-monoxide dehydrogenase medium subunit